LIGSSILVSLGRLMRSATNLRRFAGAFAFACLSLLSGWVAGQEESPRPADPARLADESLILDLTQAGQRFVAVGERGHVLLSRDGRTWEQAEHVPVQSTLTRVAFAGGRLWAVGHDATIIHSRDLGRTWSLQHWAPDLEKPLLDVHFFSANEGIAIGAYGIYLRTTNAGETWEVLNMADLVTSEAIDWEEAAQNLIGQSAASDADSDAAEVEDEYYDAALDFDRGCYEFMECHLNAFLDLGNGRFMIAAERGYGFRSSDGGMSWESFQFAYPGSMFGLLRFNENDILAFGLRGHVQVSSDFGQSWRVLDSGLQSSLKGGTLNPRGHPFMVGAGAAQLRYDPVRKRFELEEDRLGSTYAAVLFTDEGLKILAGEDGMTHE